MLSNIHTWLQWIIYTEKIVAQATAVTFVVSSHPKTDVTFPRLTHQHQALKKLITVFL